MTTYNKIIVNGVTKLDISNDSVTAAKLLSGETAHDKNGAAVTGTCDYDSNTTDATATAADMLDGVYAYINKVKTEGTMTNNGSQTGTISTKAGTVSIKQGYHDGGGSVAIASTEQAKIIAGNIKSGITLLGVEGTYTGEGASYQSKSVTPTFAVQSVTPDSGYDGLSSVSVAAIPVTEKLTTGTTGYTVTIG